MLGVEAGTLPLGSAFRYNLLSSKLGVFFTSCNFNNFLASVEEQKEAKTNTNINKMDEEIFETVILIVYVLQKGVFFECLLLLFWFMRKEEMKKVRCNEKRIGKGVG